MTTLLKTLTVAFTLIAGMAANTATFAGPDVIYGPIYPDKYKADRGE